MHRQAQCSNGFTLLEVTFATGILFLTFVLLLGALAHIAFLREVGERKLLATACLQHCLERIEAEPGALVHPDGLRAPEELPGEYIIELLEEETPGLARIRVATRTTRGHTVEVVAVVARKGAAHAP